MNGFQLDPAHDDVLLIAGGIGITPLVSMATALRADGQIICAALRRPQPATRWRWCPSCRPASAMT